MSILMYKQRFRPPNYKKHLNAIMPISDIFATRPGASKNEVCVTGCLANFIPVTW
ncbi:hypothetical protein Bccel_5460 [Pseudobacteroides cellulosolvens ATCC 35603 = DSM 2933]|uniref:Uncharacterized protein n=1 Tax=Pseudobacteroides cellulosolvens ATCC 35603 = DSM 2933 TaxID=398512 RepID=A0A0L6JWF9_9FIRM|nr:hypothetical protein Bccel_5460 [Pseudobacteroides cellulosolvens ATCC 35603 = DSM 2933]